MEKEQRMRLKAEGQSLEATIHVGKAGVSPGVEAELDAQLRRFHLVKVRIQRGAVGGDRDGEADVARSLAEELGAELVERRGHTVLLYRRGRKR